MPTIAGRPGSSTVVDARSDSSSSIVVACSRPAPPPTAIRGAVPSPVGPADRPLRAGGPAETLTTDAPSRMPATAMATARSGPSRSSQATRRQTERARAGRSRGDRRLGGPGRGTRRDRGRATARSRCAPVVRQPGSGSGAAVAGSGSVARGPAQASEDALDADRRVQQYGLLAFGRSGRGGRAWGGLGATTVRGRGIELGVSVRGRRP